jgi:hypothetical protein
LINKEYELRVSEKNKICERCCVLLERFDELQQETRTVKSILSRQIAITYDIETSEEMIFMDNSKTFVKLNQSSGNMGEIKYSCKMCRYVTTEIDSVNSHCLYHKILTESKIQANEIIKETTQSIKRNVPIGRESQNRNGSVQVVKDVPRSFVETREEIAGEENQFAACLEYEEDCLENLVDLDLLEDENCMSNLKNQTCMMNDCDVEFKYIADYVKHLRLDHKSCTLNHIFAVIRANVRRPKKTTKLSCPYCFSTAPNVELFEEHVRHHEEAAKSKVFTDRINEFVNNLIKLSNFGEHEPSKWTCRYCEEAFINTTQYNNHLALRHNRCFICFSQCHSKVILRDHICSHTR